MQRQAKIYGNLDVAISYDKILKHNFIFINTTKLKIKVI